MLTTSVRNRWVGWVAPLCCSWVSPQRMTRLHSGKHYHIFFLNCVWKELSIDSLYLMPSQPRGWYQWERTFIKSQVNKVLFSLHNIGHLALKEKTGEMKWNEMGEQEWEKKQTFYQYTRHAKVYSDLFRNLKRAPFTALGVQQAGMCVCWWGWGWGIISTLSVLHHVSVTKKKITCAYPLTVLCPTCSVHPILYTKWLVHRKRMIVVKEQAKLIELCSVAQWYDVGIWVIIPAFSTCWLQCLYAVRVAHVLVLPKGEYPGRWAAAWNKGRGGGHRIIVRKTVQKETDERK